MVTGGLRNSGPALATLTGILTDPNFRVVLRALEQRGGFESLGEPEVTTTSGRQTQMRATQIINVVTAGPAAPGASPILVAIAPSGGTAPATITGTPSSTPVSSPLPPAVLPPTTYVSNQ